MTCMLIAGLREQKLACWTKSSRQCCFYPITSSQAGEKSGSLCTPRGLHVIIEKIGHNMPENTIFIGRQPVGTYDDTMIHTREDFILTRILRLSGMNKGLNLGGETDSLSRHIYIHGSPYLGQEYTSHGCLRMNSTHIMDLFDSVPVSAQLLILEGSLPAYPVDVHLFTSPEVIRNLLSSQDHLLSLYEQSQKKSPRTTLLIAMRGESAIGFLAWHIEENTIHCLSMATIEPGIGIETQMLAFLMAKAYLIGNMRALIWQNPSAHHIPCLLDNAWKEEKPQHYSKLLNHSAE